MKKIIFVLCTAALLQSCATYYYSKLGPAGNAGFKDEYGDFISGNDSILIVYNFFGEDAPMKIEIINRSSGPVYVDWQRSALVVNDLTVNYRGETILMNGNVQANIAAGDYSGIAAGSFDGTATMHKDASFVPPHAKDIHVPVKLKGFPFDAVSKNRYQKTKFVKKNGAIINVNTVTFDRAETPLFLRSYLTVYAGDKPQVFEQSFYLTELIKTHVSPANFEDNRSARGDFFYVQDIRGGTASRVLGVVVLNAAAAAIEVQQMKNRSKEN